MGSGWGRGYPQLVPLANSDFILSSFAEELGLTGMAAILVLYLVLIQRGLRAAVTVRDGFGKLLATGLSFSLAIQLLVAHRRPADPRVRRRAPPRLDPRAVELGGP